MQGVVDTGSLRLQEVGAEHNDGALRRLPGSDDSVGDDGVVGEVPVVEADTVLAADLQVVGKHLPDEHVVPWAVADVGVKDGRFR